MSITVEDSDLELLLKCKNALAVIFDKGFDLNVFKTVNNVAEYNSFAKGCIGWTKEDYEAVNLAFYSGGII